MKQLKILTLLWFMTVLKIAGQNHYLVTSNTDSNPMVPAVGELRWAIEQANANPGLDYIDFNIPIAAPVLIQLSTTLPSISDPVIIDGNTQPGNGYTGTDPKIAIKGDLTPGNIDYIFYLYYAIIGQCDQFGNCTNVTVIADASSSEIRNLKIYECDEFAIILENVSNVKVINNVIHSSNYYGIDTYGATTSEGTATSGHHIIQGNIFGTDNTFNTLPYYSLKRGNWFEFGSDSILIGGLNPGEANYFYNTYEPPNNYFPGAVMVTGSYNKVSGNIFNNNNKNISLNPGKGCWGNFCHPSPVFQATLSGSVTTVSGTAGVNDQIEIYKTYPISNQSFSGAPPALQLLGTATANSSGQWTVNVNGLVISDRIIATATDPNGNTSEFSAMVIIQQEGPACCTNLSISPLRDAACAGPLTFTVAGCNCAPGTADEQNFIWNFGDGSPTQTGCSVSHNYTTPGMYTMGVSTSGTNGCPVATYTTPLQVVNCNPCCSLSNLSLNMEFAENFHSDFSTATFERSCIGTPYAFYLFGCTDYPYTEVWQNIGWDFGDGSPVQYGDGYSTNHTYTTPGDYTITVTIPAVFNCAAVTYSQSIHIENCIPCCSSLSMEATPAVQLSAAAVSFDNTCSGLQYNFTATGCHCYDSINGSQFSWDFGDGTPVQTGCTVAHNYNFAGTFTITLSEAGSGDCFGVSKTQTIIVYSCDPPPCESCISGFAPIGDSTYLVSTWVKETTASAMATTYANASIKVEFLNITGSATTVLGSSQQFKGEGLIIDGWQKIEKSFLMPKQISGTTVTDIRIVMECNSSGNNCEAFFDDIRIYPFKGSMKSYVYDPVNMRLVSELDERNYATIYEYDEEGKLVRIKKETEKGIMTIQENKNGIVKKP